MYHLLLVTGNWPFCSVTINVWDLRAKRSKCSRENTVQTLKVFSACNKIIIQKVRIVITKQEQVYLAS